jgi:hypothetical protein
VLLAQPVRLRLVEQLPPRPVEAAHDRVHDHARAPRRLLVVLLLPVLFFPPFDFFFTVKGKRK